MNENENLAEMFAGIFKDKTMADKLMWIPKDEKELMIHL